jgi:hypothetical protein
MVSHRQGATARSNDKFPFPSHLRAFAVLRSFRIYDLNPAPKKSGGRRTMPESEQKKRQAVKKEGGNLLRGVPPTKQLRHGLRRRSLHRLTHAIGSYPIAHLSEMIMTPGWTISRALGRKIVKVS